MTAPFILFVCEEPRHLALAQPLARSLARHGLRPAIFPRFALEAGDHEGVFEAVLTDPFAVPGFLRHAGLVLYFRNESSPFCLASVLVSFAARQQGVPGLTLRDGVLDRAAAALTRKGFQGFGTDAAMAAHQFCETLPFLGEDGIGHPACAAASDEAMRLPPEEALRILLVTNFGWGGHAPETANAFLRIVQQAATRHNFAEITHRADAGDAGPNTPAALSETVRRLELREARESVTRQDIRAADLVIATPGPAVLDAVAAGRPVLVYAPPGVADALSAWDDIRFSDDRGFDRAMAALLRDGQRNRSAEIRFREAAFLRRVEAKMAERRDLPLREEDFLQFVQGWARLCL
jgi:hypothetical protein